MAREIQGEGCALRDTKYCALLHMASCENCAAYGHEQGDLERLSADLDVLMSLLPEGGVAPLFLAEECQLCKGTAPNPRACYAMVDMAHAEPRRKKASVIGVKVKSPVGSLVPVQVACCAACRKRLRILEYLPVVVPLAVAILALLLVNIPPIGDALKAINPSLPAVFFIAATALGYLGGRIAAARQQRIYAESMELDILNLPVFRAMREKGWFPLTAERGGHVRPVFLKERLKEGVCTGEPALEAQEATAAEEV